MKRILLIVAAAVVGVCVWAQGWRVGAEGGWLYNSISRNMQYAYDFRYEGKGGFDAGLWGQYSFNSWLGVRADLMWLSRGHKMHRTYYYFAPEYYSETDGYLSLPVMATFRFGGGKWHGFLNAGGYIGYWATSHWKGEGFSLTFPETIPDVTTPEPFDCKRQFNSTRDNRFDAGLVAGVGVEYEFLPKWFVGVEGRFYYGLTSMTKNYMQHFRDPRYNNTVTVMLSISRQL